MKIIDFLRLNDYVKLFFDSVDLGLMTYCKYILFVIPIITGYSIAGHIVWGPCIFGFNTFMGSFIQILLFMVGNVDLSLFLRFSPVFTLIYFTSFYLFQLLFVCCIIIPLYGENLRKTLRKVGYPEDMQLKPWSIKDYAIWLCYCIDFTKFEN